MPAPANDNFADAIALTPGGGTQAITVSGATTETGEQDASYVGQSVWFTWTPPAGPVRVRVPSQDEGYVYMQVFAYTGSTLGSLTRVHGGLSGFENNKAEWIADGTTTYRIRVASPYDGPGGTMTYGSYTKPANDDITDAVTLDPAGGSLTFDNHLAGLQPGERPRGYGCSLWYKITPTADVGMAFDVSTSPSASTMYPSLLLYDGADLSLPAAPGYDVAPVADQAPRLVASLQAGHTYYLRTDANFPHTDNVLLWGPVTLPPGDAFETAVALTPPGGGTVAFDNSNATRQNADNEWDWTGNGTLWFSYTTPVDGAVTVDTQTTPSGSEFGADTYLAVWAGAVVVPTNDDPPNADDDDTETSSGASVTWDALAGVEYLIQLSAYDVIPDGVLTWSGPDTAAAPPAGVVRVPIRRVSPTMAALGTLDALGRPVDWTVESTVEEDWGYLRVFCGTTDVTFFRDVPTDIRFYDYTEPFEYGPAEIAFPQISPFDTLGAGDLDWFVQGMNVTLKREDPDTGELSNIWEGFASTWDPEADAKGYVFVVTCAGALAQSQLEPMPPSFDVGLVDVGAAIKEALDGVPSRRYAALPTVVTTRGTRNRGAWQSRYDYVQEILSTAYNADGTRQWTVGCNPGRFPTLHQKDMTTVHWHVSVGTPGAKLDELSDITSAPNVIFGEGIYEGGRWRNSRYPDSNPPVFVPLAYVSDNMPFTYDGAGNPTANPSFDPTRLRVARYENMGDGISKSEGAASALGELGRDVNPGWYGDLVLDIDPEEGARRDIRAGQNIALRHHHGHPTRLFHIARAHVDNRTGQVTLTIDTNARDWITLAGLRKRDREAATDPARRLNPPRRRSRMTPDARPVFDAESGAGVIPATSCAADTWTVIRIPAGRFGTISSTEFFTTSSPTRFSVGVFGVAPSTSDLAAYVGNPISDVYAWDTNAEHLDSTMHVLEAWGDGMGLGGYWPKAESDDPTPPITGVHKDKGGWDYISDDPPWLWVAVFPDSSCTFSGRLYLAPET